jgi:ABC-type transporter Mla subunit MlaD
MSEINTNNVENVLNQIKEQLDNETKVSETIAKNADKLIEAQLEKFDALSKAVDELSGKMATVTEMFANLNIPTNEDIEKHIEVKAEELSKSFDDKFEDLEKNIETTKVENEALVKKVEVLENEPVVKSTIEVEDKPEVVVETIEKSVEGPTRGDLINKALEEISTADTHRRSELFKAVSQLEAGVSIQDIKL